MPASPSIILLPLFLFGASAAGQTMADRGTVRDRTVQLAQLSIEQRVIIRIPTMPAQPKPSPDEAPATVTRWNESRGPRCVPLNLIRAAVVTSNAGVTMVVSSTERYLTHLGRACRAADFYSGFYISPNKDGIICAGRDTLHARNGSACEIERFSRLTPERVPAGSDEEHREKRSRSER